MQETITFTQRIYMLVEPGDAGRMMLRLSLKPPVLGDALAAVLMRGQIIDGSALDVDLVSDPKANPDLTGPDGPNGFTPVLVAEADGTRTLVRVADWVRSTGKPATGYLTATGALAATKAGAFNFNAVKRVDVFTALSGSDGIATVAFVPPFAGTPAKALPIAVPNLLSGPIKAELVAGTLTKDGCKVKVSTSALVTGVVTALAGASTSVIVIEA